MKKPIPINKDFFSMGMTERERHFIALVRTYSKTSIELGEIVGIIKRYVLESFQTDINKLVKLIIEDRNHGK
ncbi:hypothetical protein [uncultured Clostridium sp.]|uniref:hypothetical protein n=1 Tax=uncultured Clostridium sp. TaxID=59620 RepID=UPI0025D23478|nr:hypothetical protein [uncultured Clostridium sp.]